MGKQTYSNKSMSPGEPDLPRCPGGAQQSGGAGRRGDPLVPPASSRRRGRHQRHLPSVRGGSEVSAALCSI